MSSRELAGIAVCGGKSFRMGTDKSMLQYYSQPQRYHVVQMLQPFCSAVYISLNRKQEEFLYTNIIRDNPLHGDAGPMTALLSAYECLPGSDLLFIGCDYPLLTAHELSLFMRSVERNKTTTFFNEAEDLYEPLLGYYAAGFISDLKAYFLQGNNSLQKLLSCSAAGKYFPVDRNTIKSVDDREESGRIMDQLGNGTSFVR